MVPDTALALLRDGVGRGLRLGLRARLDRAVGLLLLIHGGEWETDLLPYFREIQSTQVIPISIKTSAGPLDFVSQHLDPPRFTKNLFTVRSGIPPSPLATLLRPLLA